MPDPTPEQLQAAFDQVVKTYSHRDNVTGVDVGFRYDKGKRTNEMAVRIHVRGKIPEHALEADEIFPKSFGGLPIDVIQAVHTPHAQPAAIEPEAVDRRQAAAQATEVPRRPNRFTTPSLTHGGRTRRPCTGGSSWP